MCACPNLCLDVCVCVCMMCVSLCVLQVDMNPALAPVYSESLRLCGTWLGETCLESPGVILEQYLEKVRTHHTHTHTHTLQP